MFFISWKFLTEIKYFPTPKLFIKDQNKLTRNGYFPTRLVIPATFEKVVHLGFKTYRRIMGLIIQDSQFSRFTGKRKIGRN